MKNTFIILAAAALTFVSCRGNIDNNGDTPSTGNEGLTLVADKTTVEASGKDYVTFQLLDENGTDLLKDRTSLQSINITSEEGVRVPRMDNKAAFIANGSYTFVAKYKGQESNNTVTVTAQNRGKYEKFHKNVAIYKLTGTWCAYCPSMTKALDAMNDDAHAHSIQLAWHASSSTSDPYALTLSGAQSDCGNFLLSHFGGSGFPSVILDLVQLTQERSASTLENAIWDIRANYPATCGLKVATSHSGSELKVDIEMTSSKGGEYDLGFAVLLNDQVYEGGTAADGKYTHIVRATTPNYWMYSESIKSVEKDGKLTMNQTVSGIESAANLSVVAFALVKHDNGARIDNIVEVEVGKTIDYVYNE